MSHQSIAHVSDLRTRQAITRQVAAINVHKAGGANELECGNINATWPYVHEKKR